MKKKILLYVGLLLIGLAIVRYLYVAELSEDGPMVDDVGNAEWDKEQRELLLNLKRQ